MSLPLLWTMLNAHTPTFSWGDPEHMSWLWIGVFLAIVALGWHIIWHLYRRAGKVKGF